MKRILVMILALMMSLSMGMSACAAEDGAAKSAPGGFSDVAADASYAEAVAWCSDNGIMNGVSETAFEPEGTLTRAMLATALYRAAGEPAVTGAPAFTDTQADTWYSNAVVWANAQGLVKGYGDGLFGTDDPVTREQLAAILWRYDGEKTLDQARISDRTAVSEYAAAAVDWVVGAGVMTYRPDDARFAPQDNATRAEIAAALFAYLSNREDAADGKTLVVYFSATGSTKAVAGYIADKLSADQFELTPAEPYTTADLNYNDSASRVSREHADEKLRAVKLTANTPANWADYDTVFIGYPIWWGIAAWPVNDFVTSNDFTGKTVIPFCTSASSGLGDSGKLLAEMAGAGNWQAGQRFSSGASRNTVEQWLATLK